MSRPNADCDVLAALPISKFAVAVSGTKSIGSHRQP